VSLIVYGNLRFYFGSAGSSFLVTFSAVAFVSVVFVLSVLFVSVVFVLSVLFVEFVVLVLLVEFVVSLVVSFSTKIIKTLVFGSYTGTE